jgi:very-short-patch-repair endonuclease
MTDPHDVDLAEVTRTPRFVKFLRAAVAVKTKPVTEVNKYSPVIWFSRLPTPLDEIRSPLLTENWPSDDIRWLVVKRVAEPARPPAPDVCQPWLTGVDLDVPNSTPALNALGEQREANGEIRQLPLSEETKTAWNVYMDRAWKPWAAKAAIARTVKPTYQTLFSAYQDMQGRADAFDVFVGAGLLDSRVDAGQRLHRHLVAFAAELTLDDKTGTISVGPAPEFVACRIETDFLAAPARARLEPQADALRESLLDLGPAVQNREALKTILTRLIVPLSAVSEYVDDLAPSDVSPGQMRVSFAPALVVRPRSTRSLDELLKRIEHDTSGENPRVPLATTPLCWRKMMEQGEAWEGSGAGGGSGPPTHNGRVFFPLPSNEEQNRIVELAPSAPGVVVQGPPGTGKSHTIANLISHYLATGQRVLVTAQTAQALEVLRDKMPQELRQLCVSLLGDSRGSDKELRRSVETILGRHQDFRPNQHARQIGELETKLTAAETRLTSLERTLHQARAAETHAVAPVPGYEGTRAAIARRLSAEREALGWIADRIPHETACPRYSAGWHQLAEYHSALDDTLRERLARRLVNPPFTRENAREVLAEIEKAKAALPADGGGTAAPIPSAIEKESLLLAEQWLVSLSNLESEVVEDDRTWSSEVRKSLLRSVANWVALRDEADRTVKALTDTVIERTVKVEVVGRPIAEARRDVRRLSDYYASGGKRRTLGLLKPAVVKACEWIEQAVTVQDAPVLTTDEVQRARWALDGWALLDVAWDVWAQWPAPRAKIVKLQASFLRHRLRLLNDLLQLSNQRPKVSDDLRKWLDERLSGETPTSDLIRAVQRRLAEITLATARTRRDQLVRQVREVVGRPGIDVVPAIPALIAALLAEDAEGVSGAFDALAEELDIREQHRVYRQFLADVRASAPKLTDAIKADEGRNAWQTGFAQFEQAWGHRCAQSWLDLVLSRENIEAMHGAARDERQRCQETLAELTAAKAWARALERIEDRRRASLVAWAQAVAKIPATGLSVFRKRAEAQRLLGGCLDSIPAWVVSLGRLYETVRPEPGLFDVAIVDEASQCWLDSLVLFYLAKKVIVVGDDKQISPTIVGVAEGEIDALGNAFLKDLEYRSQFTLGSSLFDHARRYFSAGVPLREHFRCVPEIIRFSNEQWYSANPLIPLRQVGPGRLEPLKRVYLSHGLRRGDVNDVEAAAIVDAIATCHEDPAYEETDFGVMCLQGDSQAARIEHLLLERLGPGVFRERRLRCGNPYVFQGDERDVMFISMVAASNAQQQSLTTTMYQQRFNVAMSRARDQVWLFHSIQEDELGALCLRRRVLEFFKEPTDQRIHGASLDIPELQRQATRADRSVQQAPTPFDSWFEVDVALALVARGFTVSAQVQVSGKFIDLVVEGDDGLRLAVECDGEAWHGAEQFDADIARQRQLERAKWTFVRVRESMFYADRERAIAEVVAACDELGIETGDGRARPAVPPEGPVVTVKPEPSSATEDAVVSKAASQNSLFDPIDDGTAESSDDGEDDAEPFATAPVSEDRDGPFTGYAAKDYPDPRTADATSIRVAVLDIVRTDGPLTKASIYRLYRDGCPRVQRAGKFLRQAVNRALSALEKATQVESRDEGSRRLVETVVFRAPDQPWVDCRPIGAREVDEVPLLELAEHLSRRLGHRTRVSHSEWQMAIRDIAANTLKVRRITDQLKGRIQAAAALAGLTPSPDEQGATDSHGR